MLSLLLLLLMGCVSKYQNLHESIDQTLAIIDELYPEQLDMQKLQTAMLQGLIQGADSHGSYLDEAQIKQLIEAVGGGEFKFGIQVAKHVDGIEIKKVFEKSAGQAAGLQAGDVIITFDDLPLKELSPEKFPCLIKEKKPYKLVINRGHRKLIKEIIPGYFAHPTLEFKWLKNVAYLKFGCITEDSANQVGGYLWTIKQNPKLAALILDLRDSPGGSFEAGIGIASQFLDGSVIVEMQKKDGLSKFASAGVDVLNKLPIFVLQNQSTSSAAEIISAALKAHHRAKIIGKKSAGAATAKQIARYPNRKDGLIISIAFLNDPNGKRIGKDGVEPDILIQETKVRKNKVHDLYIAEALRFVPTK